MLPACLVLGSIVACIVQQVWLTAAVLFACVALEIARRALYRAYFSAVLRPFSEAQTANLKILRGMGRAKKIEEHSEWSGEDTGHG